MKRISAGLLVLASLALLAQTGCASREQWQTWRTHPTHFASGQHMGFSIRNVGQQSGEPAESVKTTDPPNSRAQSWWGRALTNQGN